MNTIRIVAAVVDTRQLTMYKEDGTTILIPQGDPRLRRILEVATPQLQSQGWADVEISEVAENSYADFQEQAKGIRFFRVAKAKLKQLLKLEDTPDDGHVNSQIIGSVPSPAATSQPAAPVVVATAPVPSGVLTNSLGDAIAAGEAFIAAGSNTPATDHITTAGIYDVSEADEVAAAAEGWSPERMDGLDKSDDAQDAARDEAAAAAKVPDAVDAQPPVLTEVITPGTDDQAETFEPVPEQVPEPKVEQTMSVIDEIIAHAVPVTDPNFHERDIVKQRPMAIGGSTSNDHPDESAEDTIIAVVNDKVIPGVELIKSQFGRAAKMGSTKGVERFLERLAGVIESRSHSVEDLLKFMERADLPIADDGSIIIYKVLKRSSDKYVDCHTGNVQQWLGAYVCMDPSLVDRNRNNECSNGLHVARRGYISGFSGNVCVLAKLAPEDVITVPTYDANKMRVCGYHILKELPDGLYSLLKANRAITSTDDGKRILADAINGNHTRKTHEVRITGQRGGGVITKEIPKDDEPAPILTPEAPTEAEALPEDHDHVDAPVAPAEVEQVAQTAMTKREQAQALYDAWSSAPEGEAKDAALVALLDFKKQAKKSWDVLGILDPQATKSPQTEPKPDPAQVKRIAKVINKVAPPPVKKVLPAASEGSPRERISKLMEIGLDSQGIAQKVYDIKKASKKSWETLGLTEEQSIKVLKAIGKITE